MQITNKLVLAAGISASLAMAANSVAAQDDEWAFAIAPLYIWGKNIDAVSSAGGKELPLDLDFQEDILENLDAAIALHAEATKGKLTLFAEYNYARLEPEGTAQAGPVTVDADITFRDTMIEGGLAWAFADSGSMRWEILGGLRYYKQDVKVKLQSSLPGGGPLPNRISAGDSWMQPFAGVRVVTDISERWSFRARGDYGYEGADNTSLQGIAMFDYRFRDWGSAFVGYRYLDTDFSNGSARRDEYSFDGDQQGPLVGLNLYF